MFTFAKKYVQVQGYRRGKADMGRGNERDRTSCHNHKKGADQRADSHSVSESLHFTVSANAVVQKTIARELN